MPELKNNFLKSKMNKDLDERLVPNGEYRNALGVNIRQSEGQKVYGIIYFIVKSTNKTHVWI